MMVVLTIVITAMTIVHLTLLMERHVMSVRVMTETLVTNGMRAPICMIALPVVESQQTRRVQGQPHVVGAQIIIL